MMKSSSRLTLTKFHGGEELICLNRKIFVPTSLRRRVVEWYHTYLLHPGESRTEGTIMQYLYWPNIRKTVKDIVSKCETCQKCKKQKLKYGHIPPKEAETIPWQHLCVDAIGPYKIKRRGQPELTFRAITMIDPATGWFDMAIFKTGMADESANIVEQTWLTRYPLPEYITFDQGTEFKAEFRRTMEDEYQLKQNQFQ